MCWCDSEPRSLRIGASMTVGFIVMTSVSRVP